MKTKIFALAITIILLLTACFFALNSRQPLVVQAPAPTPAASEPVPTSVPAATSAPTPAPTAEPTPAPTAISDPLALVLEQRLSAMSLAEKVGQMFILSCSPTEDTITSYKPAGYVLFGRYVADDTPETLLAKIQGFQAQSTTAMLFAVDEEGGTTNRLSNYTAYRSTPYQSPQTLYATGGMALILEDLADKAQLLLGVGINVNLAPVADVSTDPEDFMYDRSLGLDAATTADYIAQVVAAAKELKLGTTLKHFPGYGNNADTHSGTAVDTHTLERLHEIDLLPFAAGIAAGADSILVSHNIVNSIDDAAPASFSAPVHALLREELGFTGVILTDDLTMGAAQNYGDPNTNAVDAILAGNDLVMCANYETQIPAVIAAVTDGTLSESQLDASVRRVLTWKYNLGLLDS